METGNQINFEGRIRLEIPENHVYYLTVDVGAGDVELYGIVPKGLQVNVGAGNIWPNYVSARESIELNTGEGAINGVLQGSASDYMVDATVGSGSNNLGDTSSGHIKLWVSVGTGEIDVYFEE